MFLYILREIGERSSLQWSRVSLLSQNTRIAVTHASLQFLPAPILAAYEPDAAEPLELISIEAPIVQLGRLPTVRKIESQIFDSNRDHHPASDSM
ncbi:MAG: hypothetical protein NTX50_31045 [Candidatus Sumerlaeota bacterium]|nr:hypothetical protein [Candidatus Sumerlaeota bacterium]